MNKVVEWLESAEGQEWSQELNGHSPGVLGYRRMRPDQPDQNGCRPMGHAAFASVEEDHVCDRVGMQACIPSKGIFYMGKAYDTSYRSKATIDWAWTEDDLADLPKGLSCPA